MKRAKKSFKAIFAVLLSGAVIMITSLVFAQGGTIAGSVKDLYNDKGIPGVAITVKDESTGKLAGKGTTDALGNYAVSISALGKYTLLAAKYGYRNMTALNIIELSDITKDLTVNVSMGRYAWLKEQREGPTPPLYWDTESGKSYLIPALEIPAFILLLNGADRLIYPNLMEDGKKVYSSSLSTFRGHVLHGPWTVDTDSFAMNQFGHPYQGLMYYGYARSAGLSFWQSFIYTNIGSFLWETGGETTRPSINDQIASGVGGSFFGEALFRMASRVLESHGDKPGFWRELSAAILKPSLGINRLAFGERFKPVFPSNNPAISWRLRFGASLNSSLKDKGYDSLINKNEATADYSIAYGLPGKAYYSYNRPFDYFNFEFSTLANSTNPFDNIMLRGLLLGKEYEAGDGYRGIWGLYGGYDYISPHVFRVSSTSASIGTTYQWWLSRAVALQGSALGGIGYAAAGNVAQTGERDYHYGVAPQGLIALRLNFGEIAMFDLTERVYYISGTGGNDPGGKEEINRLNMGLTFHIYGRHALGLQYITSIRNARYPDRPRSHQSLGTFSLVYTLLGDSGFGAVEWRDETEKDGH
ncbi:MAG: DUF3943 domain-containing protein [Dehalococcoidales bacterium]|nr:DUF3943 domain-containing protein [Dehalococcoidales bacterium]